MNQWIATHAKYTDKIASDPLKWEFNEWLNLDNYLSKFSSPDETAFSF